MSTALEVRVRAAKAAETALLVKTATPFRIPRCARCRAPLCTPGGSPRWDLIEPFGFICRDACDSQLVLDR